MMPYLIVVALFLVLVGCWLLLSSRADRAVVHWLRTNEPDFSIGHHWSKRVASKRRTWIVAIKHGDITGHGKAYRYFAVDLTGANVRELPKDDALTLLSQ